MTRITRESDMKFICIMSTEPVYGVVEGSQTVMDLDLDDVGRECCLVRQAIRQPLLPHRATCG